MAMDFFEHQEVARKKTGRLIILFAVAVIAIMVMVYLLFALVFIGVQAKTHAGESAQLDVLFHPGLFAMVVIGTLVVVGGGSMFKMAQLRAGGRVIAEQLGGKPVTHDTADAVERKVLNVVEEMAIAAGTPVPPVYVLDQEGGINAFAAGYTPSDAVIGVTRGCAERLSRDELQGVIAHEFSHILNGDMRMNIRLMGVLHGILIIGIIGYFLLRSSFYAGAARRRSSKDNSAMAILALGVGLAVIGFVGTLFGNMIKAAVSRQREFLADASAVQFTRNPDGIAGALRKIGGFSTGARIDNPNAPQASHMFFGQAITSGLNSMMATHPPLGQRIKRIDPSWEGKFAKSDAAPSAAAAGVSGFAAGSTAAERAAPAPPVRNAVSQIGMLTQAHIEYAASLVAGLPREVTDAAHEAYGARSLIYCLLINAEQKPRAIQLERLGQHADPAVRDATVKLLPIVEKLDPKVRLPIIDLAIPALRALSPTQYAAFRRNVEELVRADDRIDLFEWALQRILLHHLDPQFTRARPARVQYYGLNRLSEPLEVLLSTLAYAGHRDRNQARLAMGHAAKHLRMPQPKLRPVDQCGIAAVDAAMNELVKVAPRLKKQILLACAASVSADKKVTVNEAELLRAIADSLGVPMPPLLPGQPLI
ncbi:MAG: M48 family metallopeptidase [Phycisphaerales bacterium]|nr:M48 family metallopeptidase [Phycisphaerales bacterium]